jgi:hypothetical protein
MDLLTNGPIPARTRRPNADSFITGKAGCEKEAHKRAVFLTLKEIEGSPAPFSSFTTVPMSFFYDLMPGDFSFV